MSPRPADERICGTLTIPLLSLAGSMFDRDNSHLVRRAGRRMFYTSFVEFADDLTSEPGWSARLAAPGEAGVEVRMLEPTDVDAYVRGRSDQTRETIEERLATGQVCAAVWLDGEIVAAGWARFDVAWLPIVNYRRELPPMSAYAHDDWTDAAHRRRGFARLRMEALRENVRAMGYERSVAYVLAGEGTAMAAAKGYGYRPIGRVRWIHLGPVGVMIENRDRHVRRVARLRRGAIGDEVGAARV
jgi:GNAT superfamily N-acetyltransferase